MAIRIPGVANQAEAAADRLSEAVWYHLNLHMPPQEQKPPPPKVRP